MADSEGNAAPAAAAPGSTPAAVEAADGGNVQRGLADDGDAGAAADREPEPEEAEGELDGGVVADPCPEPISARTLSRTLDRAASS